MTRWDQRPVEERNLFNPAFCGLVICRALAGYQEENSEGMPFSLALLVLPLCLHGATREVLARSKKSYLLKAIVSNPQLLIGFADRASALRLYTFEALAFAMHMGSLSVDERGQIRLLPKGIRKSITGTDEAIACQRIARFIGKEFAKIGDRATVYTLFGIRP